MKRDHNDPAFDSTDYSPANAGGSDSEAEKKESGESLAPATEKKGMSRKTKLIIAAAIGIVLLIIAIACMRRCRRGCCED